MDKKYQVFISSTYTDLKEERTKVRDAVLSTMNFPVGMELFGATDDESWKVITDTIDSSDYYVLIIGNRYGSVIKNDGISFTEKEYHYARAKGVPVLAFLISDSVIPTVDKVDDEQSKRNKLATFKQCVSEAHNVDWWSNPDELAQKVTASLYNHITRIKRPGWIRGDVIDVEKSLAEILDLNNRLHSLEDENKRLLLENQKLKEKTGRKPKLIITFSADIPDEDEQEDGLYSRRDNISTDEEDESVHLKVGCLGTASVESKYSPINKSDFIGELRGHVTDEEIQAYNENLPSREELDAYLKAYKSYHMIVDHGIASILTIHNIGTAKATDISATVEFPDEIMVYDIDDVRQMTEPKAPEKPRDLREIAYERAHKSEIALEKMYAQLAQAGMARSSLIPTLISPGIGNAIYETVEVSNNTVEIETKRDIVHTRWDWFSGIYIVPTMKGTFKAKVSLMCAEYEDIEESEITFICE